MIVGHGPTQPAAIFLGDGAGPEEADSNYAFHGNPERTFSQLLNTSGLQWSQFYKTLLIKEKISFNADKKKGKKPIPYHELPETLAKVPFYQDIVSQEIKDINPNLIIPTGEISFNWLTGLSGIRKFRGSVVLSKETFGLNRQIKVLPILGPQPYLNNEYELRHVTRIDCNKISKYISDAEPPEQLHKIWIARTSSSLRTFFERSYKPDSILVFDIETFMGIPTCISFCFDGDESVCVPFTDKGIDRDNRALMIQLVAQMLASPIRKVNQNIKYDWKVLERFGFVVRNIVGDTMLAASCIYPEFPKSLGFLTSIYTDLPYFKDEGKVVEYAKHHKDRFYLYNAKDSLATHQVYHKQLLELNEMGTRQVYDNMMLCLPIYKKMEERGFRIDEEKRVKLLGKYTALFNIHVRKVQRLVGNYNFNPISSTQAATVVYDLLGFPRDRMAKATGEEELEYLMAFKEAKHSPIYGIEILKGIINCRKLHKVIELLELATYFDGRWRCEYKLGGTETGRTSAGVTTDQLIIRPEKGKKEFDIIHLGHSFQTIGKHGFWIDGEEYGKDIRDIIIPSPGYTFVEIDLSQAEARVDAVLAGNFDILKVFDGPIGIHRLTGSWAFGVDPLTIKKNTLQYLMAKTVRHAGERNMKEDRLVMMTQQPKAECARILRIFHQYQPEIVEVYHRQVKECIDLNRTLISPNGRTRMFMGRVDHKLYNEAISQLPQAIVSDQVKFSFHKTMAKCGEYAYLLNEAHDGALAEVEIGKEGYYIDEYVKNVTVPINFNTCSLRRDFELVIPAEAETSQESWYRLKEWKG